MNQDPTEEFIRFVEETATALYAYALGTCRNKALAEDLVQEFYLKMWKSWDRSREKVTGARGANIGYGIRSIYNSNVSHWRKERRLTKRDVEDKDFEFSYPLFARWTAEDEFLFTHTARELWAAVSRLDPDYQTLLFLHYVDNYSIAKSAKEIGLSETTAHRYHKRALSRLRELIEGSE
ncbi:sigma-70 family RNA polymerase sigma factor (plasmid) [Streptomyces sp. NBC_00868]|uniref:RNA polymerase sigma factor n=1 Tax=Streptomyces sp. NBC_00868 TaxID=2903683 RepID=UPI00387095EC|nr:sigma-70 family RNA polymerase sigma factor [Streptomyces sp. NBC_00868]